MSRGLKALFVVSILLLAVIIGVCGCGKGDKILDPPNTDQPKTTKPVAPKSVYDNEDNTAWVCALITENGQPFYKPDHYVVFSKAVSGRKISGGPFGILQEPGKAIVKILSGREIINGYYRARLIRFDSGVNEIVVTEWANIPINRKDSLVLELPIGEKAKDLSHQSADPVYVIYPNHRTKVVGDGPVVYEPQWKVGWRQTFFTVPKEARGKDINVSYYLTKVRSGIEFSTGAWLVRSPEYPDILSIKYFVPWYAAGEKHKLRLLVRIVSTKIEYNAVSEVFDVVKP